MAKPAPKTDRDRAAERGALLAPQVRVDRGDVELETPTTIGRGRKGERRGDVVRSRLWRAHRNGDLTDDQYAAGERFALTAERSSASVRSTLGRDELRGGEYDRLIVTDGNWRRAKAGIELRAACVAVGPVLLPALCWVAVQGRAADEWATSVGKPPRHGIAALCLALDALVDHWKTRR